MVKTTPTDIQWAAPSTTTTITTHNKNSTSKQMERATYESGVKLLWNGSIYYTDCFAQRQIRQHQNSLIPFENFHINTPKAMPHDKMCARANASDFSSSTFDSISMLCVWAPHFWVVGSNSYIYWLAGWLFWADYHIFTMCVCVWIAVQICENKSHISNAMSLGKRTKSKLFHLTRCMCFLDIFEIFFECSPYRARAIFANISAKP